MRILIVAAHPDDELLGVGATLHKFVRKGWQIDARTLGNCRSDPLDNRLDSVQLADTVSRVEEWISEWGPDRIYTHSKADLNIDHLTAHRAVLTATRPYSKTFVSEVYSFETPSSTEWNFGTTFNPTVFEKVTEQDMKSKVDSLYKLYPEEMREAPCPRSAHYLSTMAARWGAVIGCAYAEAFETVRVVR